MNPVDSELVVRINLLVNAHSNSNSLNYMNAALNSI